MAKEEGIVVNAAVSECLGHDRFAVKLENGADVIAHLSGKMRKNHIRVLPGDELLVELSPYDLTRGRITFRKRT